MRRRTLVLAASSCLLLTFGIAAGLRTGGDPSPQPRAGAPAAARPARVTRPGSPATVTEAEWKKLEQLIGEQKMSEAQDLVDAYLARVEGKADAAAWTRALTEAAKLRIALGAYEGAVKILRAHPWPEEPTARVTLDLYYGATLVEYYEEYAWEVDRRERVEGGGDDVRLWTREQIYAAAVAAYADAWKRRAAFGAAPVARLEPYVSANDYPAAVRGTMRDAVSYLFAELLANTALWTPAQTNDVYRLDLDALLAGAPKPGLDPGAGNVHPLLELDAVLADLEAWHAGRGEREAVLETRLARARHLDEAFTLESDKAKIRADLERRLAAFRDVPWWSEGVATLAALLRADPAPNALRHAHDLLAQGEKAYPRTRGADRCRAAREALEAPDFSVTAMAADAPGRRSIQVTHRNLAHLYFRAYPLDLQGRLESGVNEPFPDGADAESYAGRHAPIARWTADLPATPDFRSHRTFVVPALDAPGTYLVLVSARADFAPAKNRILGVGMALGDLVLVTTQEGGGRSRLRVLSGATGEPVAGAEVKVYRKDWQRGPQRVLAARSGDDGFVLLPPAPDGGAWWGGIALARRGADVAWQEIGMPGRAGREDRDQSLIFTDRSIYRPQQTLRYKVLVYGGDRAAGKLAPRPQAPVTVTLHDPNGQEVAKATLSSNRYGTAAGEFAIPAGRPLGAWRVNVVPYGTAVVRVEEYKRPTFEVTLQAPEQALRLNRPGTLRGEARYYFGLPVASGTARWRVTRQPVLPGWWTWWGWWGGRAPNPQVVAAGASPLDENGAFDARFTPAADERAAGNAEVSYRYHFAVDVTDEGGETRSAERDFRLGAVAVAAHVEGDRGFFDAGAAPAFDVVRTDLDGEPRAGQGRWRLVTLAQPDAPVMPADEPEPAPPGSAGETDAALRTPGDLLKPRWQTDADWRRTLRAWGDGNEVARGELTHDAKGVAHLALPALDAGAYRVRYETVDPYGATATLQYELVVAGRGLHLAVPAMLVAQTGTADVGGTARFLVWSGFGDQTLFLERYRDGALVERRRVAPDTGVVELPLGADDRGGFAMRLTVLRDHQLLQPVAGFAVPWRDKSLDVAFTTFRDRLRPGARETFRVRVTRADGGAEVPAAEVLAYMYDRSLDLFAPHQPPSPLGLFPSRGALGWTTHSLGQREASWVRQEEFADVLPASDWTGDRVVTYSGYGIGGPGVRGGPRGGIPGGVAGGYASRAAPVAAMAIPAPMLAKEAREQDAPESKALGYLADARSAGAAPPPAPGTPAVEVRSNFAETAFWQPTLLTGADGTATIEFTVPDSVTSWKVWAHALTTDLASGSAMRETQSVKDLMVRPYLPRFLREGDAATLAVVINNASDQEAKGTFEIELVDARDGASRLADFGVTPALARQPFVAKPRGSARLSIPVVAPSGLGEIAVKVVATAGVVSDGELRPLPLLPSRLHLAQSRFAALHGKETRELTFADLRRDDDPTRASEQLVVTLDAQLFYGVLQALPYLVDYPYECTEQTLNRFLSTGIVSSLFAKYPAVGAMAARLAQRDTQLETFDGADPNRKLALEETPWLELSQGRLPGRHLPDDPDPDLVRVLDPRVARAERAAALAKLQKAQLPSGAFPWWPGGPPSDFMTLYLMYGFAKAAEFGVEVPRPMVERGWQYLGQRYAADFRRTIDRVDCDCSWEFLTFLNYTASAYPDASVVDPALPRSERLRILDASFRHWKEHSPYLKGLLALTLQRMGRPQNAKLVFDSVMDSAQTTADEGTFWAPEERSWLWYNDTIESHAFALRALMELRPDDPRQEGLVQWLFVNKKLNHWKSTRATGEVLYALAKYLDATKQLGVREAATVRVAGQTTSFVFEPDRYTGRKNQIVVPGEKLSPQDATVTVAKDTPGLMFASATWHFATDRLPAEGSGDLFHVARRYFRRVKTGTETVLQPLAEGEALAVGDEVEVQLSLSARAPAEYVHLRDPRAAGLEPENARSGWTFDLGLARYEEVRDSGNNFFVEWLPQGEYTLKYRLRANLAGTFRVGPATVQSMYAPEFTAYSAGRVLTVKGD